MPTVGPSSESWRSLSHPWQRSFELAWESFCAGSPPVGAVVVDAHGEVVAEGRSRRAEAAAPVNQLAGSRLAHAEVNALAQLRPDQHEELVLYTTLEPCFLCSAAMSIAHVRLLNYAGGDPMWRFVDELPSRYPALQERWYTARGPMPGPLGAWAALLPIVERLQRRPNGPRVEEFTRTSPDLVQLAARLVEQGAVGHLAGQSLPEALEAVWGDLLTLTD